jgi:insulysin
MHSWFKTLAWSLLLISTTPHAFSQERKKDLSSPLITEAYGSQIWSSYRLSNGLDVLVISDGRMQKASAAMSVAVGGWSDPTASLGIAHFLEHMLFLGTKSFPQVEDYGRFISSNGGEFNAATGDTTTNYYFDVNPDAFNGALERFSKFFSEPRFDPNYVEREKTAVNSEYQMDVRSEESRVQRIAQLMSPSNHPKRNFNIGSLETLHKIDRPTLIRFYEEHYSSNNMKLVILTQQPIEAIKDFIDSLFSVVPNRNLETDFYAQLPNSVQSGLWTDVKAIHGSNSLRILFPTPSTHAERDSAPLQIITNLLSDESAGTPTAVLKKLNLITGMRCGASDEGDSGSFSFDVQLTDKGAANLKTIFATIFSYIGTLKREGLRRYTFDETVSMARLSLKSRPVIEGGDTAAFYAEKMHKTRPTSLISEMYEYKTYDPKIFEEYLSYLTPAKMSVIHTFPNAETDRNEMYYKIDYRSLVVPKSFLANLTEENYYNEVFYQAANPYIPQNLSIYHDEDSEIPRLLVNNERGSLYFLQESRDIVQPNGYVNLLIFSEKIAQSPRTELLAYLYRKAIANSINEMTYPMRKAGFTIHFDADLRDFIPSADLNAIVLTIDGYSDGLQKVTRDLVKGMGALRISEEDFQTLKEDAARSFADAAKLPALKRVITQSLSMMTNIGFTAEEMNIELGNVTKQELEKFASDLLKEIHVEALVYGNVRAAESSNLIDSVYQSLNAKPLSEERTEALRLKHYLVPKGVKLVNLISGEDNNNAMMTVYQAGPYSPDSEAKAELVSDLFETSYFEEMRTKRQLGYAVSSQSSPNGQIANQTFMIQSSHSANEVALLSNMFIQTLVKETIVQLDKTLEPAKMSLQLKLLRQKNPTSMSQKNSALAKILYENHGDFSSSDAVIRAVRKIRTDDVRDYLRTTFTPETQSRFSVYYSGNGNVKLAHPLTDESVVTNRNDLLRTKKASAP